MASLFSLNSRPQTLLRLASAANRSLYRRNFHLTTAGEEHYNTGSSSTNNHTQLDKSQMMTSSRLLLRPDLLYLKLLGLRLQKRLGMLPRAENNNFTSLLNT
jgi:hypothetical protein